jgi:glycosyltransferase involved in cell wall biosynthesis
MKNIGLVLFAQSQASVQPCLHLLNIIQNVADNYYIIMVHNENLDIPHINDSSIFNSRIVYKNDLSFLSMPLNFIKSELKISYILLNNFSKIRTWVFFMGETSVLPLLLLKLLKKKSVLCLSGSLENDLKFRQPPFSKFISFCGKLGLKFSDYLVVYSQNLIVEWSLKNYSSKILVAHEHFLDFTQFCILKKIRERELIIGYVGRLSDEKGIFNFVKAIPELLNQQPKFKFIIAGSGSLQEPIETFLHSKKIDDKVKLVGWISHNKLPDCLNNLKLLVLPSYTEGLPNIILESMACGTPVLATSVGSIPDIVIDEKTGFILKDNSPESIKENVMKAIDSPNLEQIVYNARSLVEHKYTLQAAVKNYKEVFKKIYSKNKKSIT